MRTFFVFLGGELLPFNRRSLARRFFSSNRITSSLSRVYKSVSNIGTGFGSDQELLDLFIRMQWTEQIISSNPSDYTIDQVNSCLNNQKRIGQTLFSRGLKLPVASLTSYDPGPQAAWDWWSDWVDWACGDLDGPVQPPGWCG